MATTLLSGSAAARLPRGPLTVHVQVEGSGAVPEITVVPSVRTVRPRPGMVIIPKLPEPVSLSITPRGGTLFGAGAALHVSAWVGDAADPDVERIVVPAIDVGGLGIKQLLEIAPDRDDVVLRLPEPNLDPTLTPLGTAALVAARTITARAPSDRRTERLVVTIDGSASMAAFIADGSIRDVVDVLTGVAVVVATDKELHAEIALGRRTVDIEATPATLAERVQSALESATLTTGWAVPTGASDLQATQRFLVSDEVPGDGMPANTHVAVLAPASMEPLFALTDQGQVTVLDPGRGEGLGRHLMDNPREMERVVGQLLRLQAAGLRG